MDILAVCALAVVSAAAALLLRRQSPQISMLISIAAGAIILLSVTRSLILTADEINLILSEGGVDPEYIMILLKALGICFITEFACDTVTEAGMLSLSSCLSFAGKILVFATALPMLRDVLSIISGLVTEV